MVYYSEIPVSPSSERFVNHIWCLDNLTSPEPKLGNQFLPNGCFEIGFVVGRGLKVHFPTKSYNITEGVYLCSQITQKTTVDIEPFTKIILIQLHAWTFSFFPQYDLTGFLNSVVRLRPNSFLPRFREYFNLEDVEKILKTTDKLCEQLNYKCIEETLAEIICRRILTRSTSVSSLVEESGCSVRTAQLKFKRSTGLTIKQYIKLINFRESINPLKDSTERAHLTSLAIEYGYFDQSHYNKTFKEIVRLTPKEFHPKTFIFSIKQ